MNLRLTSPAGGATLRGVLPSPGRSSRPTVNLHPTTHLVGPDSSEALAMRAPWNRAVGAGAHQAVEESAFMSVRFDDLLPLDPRFRDCSDAAQLLHVAAYSYAARYLTDGLIRQKDLPAVRPASDYLPLIRELERAGFWTICPEGWMLSEFLRWNGSREDVEKKRVDRSEAGKKGADSRWSKHRLHQEDEANAMAFAMPGRNASASASASSSEPHESESPNGLSSPGKPGRRVTVDIGPGWEALVTLGCRSLTKQRRARLEAIAREHDPEAVPDVVRWWQSSPDPRAAYLRDNRYGADTILRPAHFTDYLERARNGGPAGNGKGSAPGRNLVREAIRLRKEAESRGDS